MKVDRSKLKKSVSEVPGDCKALIEKLKACNDDELLNELKQIKSWNYGKCELYHWIDILDKFDGILESACQTAAGDNWVLPCDVAENQKLKQLLHSMLYFTALLIEHSFSRHLYNSMEHLTTLLSSSHMQTVLAVLNLVYVFSKRSNFIIKLAADKRAALLNRLSDLAESWGGKDNGFGLAQCCQDLAEQDFPASATTLHFEFYVESKDSKGPRKSTGNVVSIIHIDNVDKVADSPALIMEDLMKTFDVPKDKQMALFTHIRLAHGFAGHEKRLLSVQARLQALSILVYSSAIQDVSNSLLYDGLIEELVDVLELKDTRLMEIKAASLKTLTSIIHLERNPKLNTIIDATGASSYHGFLPVLVRRCIQGMIDPDTEPFPQPFATALFSFLYHLASYEAGGEALVSCGMMESLLKVISHPGDEQTHTTFVTRAVRVVDLITNLDMGAFQNHNGLTVFIERLQHEVEICRREVPYVIKPTFNNQPAEDGLEEHDDTAGSPHQMYDEAVAMETDNTAAGTNLEGGGSGMEINEDVDDDGSHELSDTDSNKTGKPGSQCFPQRAALLKSMLNFLKKAIQDPAFSDSIRHVMDGSLPSSLKHVISNAEYYGPSLFLLACELVTVYVFQEPSLLSPLQDSGLTDVMLHALLIKDVPATKEVLGSLPNVFSALCLNARGLQAFVRCKPFEKLFKVLLSPDYLPAMRRRRSSEPAGDTASNLGSAMDELMRHQPSLRTDATKAIIKLLEEVCAMGRDAKYVCSRSSSKPETATPAVMRSTANENEVSSEDEEDEDDVSSTTSQTSTQKTETEAQASGSETRIPIPLLDYVLNVMKFVESILSNNTTDDHCREFVAQKGLVPLMGILGLPNLPVDFPTTPACQAVASVCKSILTLAHEPQVLKQGLLHLNEVLQSLQPLHQPVDLPGGSVLLRELANSPSVVEAPLSASATPLLHSMAAAHAYIMMFVHVCRVGSSDIRTISINHWGSDLGQNVLEGLSKLYSSLVWESTILLALCTPDSLPNTSEFGKGDMEKLLPKDFQPEVVPGKPGKGKLDDKKETMTSNNARTNDAAGVPMDTSSDTITPMDIDEDKGDTTLDGKGKSKMTPQLAHQVKQIKPLLSASSRLGRALAELFGLLVKLCVGSPVRQRRSHHLPSNPSLPPEPARLTATSLCKLLGSGLSWEPPTTSPTPRFRLTFFICSVGFTSSMLFDEKKYPYHLMLQKFMSSGGHSALFKTFSWALSNGGILDVKDGLEHEDLPDGTGEFLDAWLMLVEKMVNTKAVLESPHTLPAKISQPGIVPFSPVQFLIHTHKAAFNAIMNLWDRKPLKVYGGRMSESMLAILCHILRGEAVIMERMEKEKLILGVPAESASTSNTTTTTGGGGGGGGGGSGSGSGSGGGGGGGGGSGGGTSSGSGTGGGGGGVGGGSSSGSGGISASSVLGGFGGILGRAREPEPNPQHMQQLMDMGFTREHAREALSHTSSIEQATEWILTHPPPLPTGSQDLVADLGLTEEDQMMRAIAMSLGENVLMSTEEEEEKKKKEEEKKKEEQRKSLEDKDKIRIENPLEKEVLNNFTAKMMPGCLKLLDLLPDTVYRMCDLLVVANVRNGDEWRDEMLLCLVQQISECAMVLLKAAAPMTTSDTRTLSEWAKQLTSLPEAAKLASRIHLFSLLFEQMKIPCAQAVEKSAVLDTLVRLLDATQQCLAAAKDNSTPKYLASLMLLIDLYEKTSMATKRRKEQRKVASHTWKWFDDRNGKWCHYSANNNKTIDDAYYAGESSIRFAAGRRRYTVQFNHMVQINEETGNRRPVMLTMPPKEEEQDKKNDAKDKDEPEEPGKKRKTDMDDGPPSSERKLTSDIEGASSAKQAKKKDGKAESGEKEKPVIVVPGLMSDQIQTIIRCCVGLISIPVDADTLHSVMRVTLRFTRQHQFAVMFAELEGPKKLLSLRQPSSFSGFASLTTLIIRHVLEEPTTLKYTMEKVVRAAATGNIGSSICGVSAGTIGAKEFHYMMRVLGPAASRNPDLFVDVAKDVLRVALPPPSRRDDDESRLVGPSVPQILKTLPAKSATPGAMDGPIKQVLCDLLNALAEPVEDVTNEENKPKVDNDENHSMVQEEIGQVLREVGDDFIRQYSRSGSGSNSGDNRSVQRQHSELGVERVEEENQSAESGPSTGESSASVASSTDSKSTSKDESNKSTKDEQAKAAIAKRALMPKSAILRLLAELVRSYSGCASMIAQYHFTAGQTVNVKEECHVLAYIMDNLLPQCQTAGDKDTPPLARVFLASLAACIHSTETQTALVNEVKAALGRALALPESTEKHSKVQAFTGLISIMIDACPPTGAYHQTQTFKSQTNGMNNIIRMLLKRGLVADLSRIPHNLDLSSPSMAATVNAALKPLETLTRIVNQPTAATSSKTIKKVGRTGDTVTTEETTTQQQGDSTTTAGETGEANTQSTPGVGEESQTNTDMLDINEGEQLETEGAQSQEDDSQIVEEHAMGGGSDLDDIMDELLERGGAAGPQVLEDTLITAPAPTRFMDEGDSQDEDACHDDDAGECTLDEDLDAEMASHQDSREDDDDVDADGCVVDIHDQDRDSSSSDDDTVSEEDHQVDDDDNEDDDDGDEDEDGSDMEAEEDDYQDIDESFDVRMPVHERDDDFFIHLEDMFPNDSSYLDDGSFLSGVPESFRTLQLPVSVHDDVSNANDPAGPSIPPAPGGVAVNHPLLIRHTDHSHLTHTHSHSSRLHRTTSRQRHRAAQAIRVYHTGNQQPNPPVILQRLLGPTVAADVLQLTSSLSSSHGGPARVLVGENDFRVLTRADDDLFDDFFHDTYNEGFGNTHISNVPSPLSRWAEESRVLDGESVHDLVTVLKPPILEVLEKHRDQEIVERREKRKKDQEEEAKKKETEEKNKKEKASSEQSKESRESMELEVDNSDRMSTSQASEAISSMAASIAATAVHLGTSAVAGVTTSEAITTSATVSSTPTTPDSATPTMCTEQSSPPAVPTVTTVTAQVFNTPADIRMIPNVTPSAPRTDRLVDDAPPTAPPSIPDFSHLGLSHVSDIARSVAVDLFTGQDTPAPASGQERIDNQGTTSELTGAMAQTSEEESGTSAATVTQNEPTPMSVDTETERQTPGVGSDEMTSGESVEAATSTSEVGNVVPSASTSTSSGSIVSTSSENIQNQENSERNNEGRSQSENTGGAPTITASGQDNQPTGQPQAGDSVQSSGEQGALDILHGIQLPEGVDPSFLAALPENIRQEVLQEHLGIQQPRQPPAGDGSTGSTATAGTAAGNGNSATTETTSLSQVNPEFLAALPPHIQEEVLQQERAEQQRLIAQQQGQSTSQEPVDPAQFIQNLPPSLRQTVLQDMDDSNVALLPADIAAEAQALRREMQLRRTQERLMHENSVLSALFRSGFPGRVGRGVTYARVSIPQSRGGHWTWGNVNRNAQSAIGASAIAKFRGRQLVDAEALTCLLVLLFVDEPKLNTGRLHRVLRNLCYHQPTRAWVIQSLLGIMERTNTCKLSRSNSQSSQTSDVLEVLPLPMQRTDPSKTSQPSWLSVSMDAALGCRTNVFQVQRSSSSKKGSDRSSSVVQIHPQAAPVVCRHVLDTLISLAKIFPSQFVPPKAKESQSCSSEDKPEDSSKVTTKSSSQVSIQSSASSSKQTAKQDSDFWELLIKLDNTSIGKKGKSTLKSHMNSTIDKENIDQSPEAPLSNLMIHLSHPVVRRSAVLTDRLLRLLSLISTALPETHKASDKVSFDPGRESIITRETQHIVQGIVTESSTGPLESSETIRNRSQDTETTSSTGQVESMEAQATIESKPVKKKEESKESKEKEKTDPLVAEKYLQLAVDVLISHSCTEEGLEDATNLLLHLSKHEHTRETVLSLLLVGAQTLGFTLCNDIKVLLKELKEHNMKTLGSPDAEGGEEPSTSSGLTHGILADRFNRGVRVVLTAPANRKGGYELRLPSMSLFTSKTSTQQFFLRILNVIIELRAKRLKEIQARQAREKEVKEREARELEARETDGNRATNTNSAQSAEGGETQENTESTASEQRPSSMESDTNQGTASGEDNNEEANTNQGTAASSSSEAPMEVEEVAVAASASGGGEGTSSDATKDDDQKEDIIPRLSEQLELEELWDTLSECLSELKETADDHAVLVLQTAVEAFFQVHSTEKSSSKPGELQRHLSREASYSVSSLDLGPLSPAPATPGLSGPPSSPFSRDSSISLIPPHLPPDTQKFLQFAETHRVVLNQILRQSSTPLGDGPFSVLVDYTRVLDFDVKRRYFRQELKRMDDGMRREDLQVHIKRENVFEDSFRELHRRSADEWKNRFYIVYEGEEGQDAGGLLREWYLIISREIFNQMYALFKTSPGDRVTYIPNPASHCNPNHLSYFKFVGRVIAKAIYDNKLLECYFSRSFYKHILGKPVKYIDMESEDYAFYQGLVFLLEHDVSELGYELTFSTEVEEFGVTEVRDLKPNGRNIIVTRENKHEYVNLVCQMKMTGAIRKQIDSFLEGFYDIIPKRLISIFNEQELELLISGLPTIDIDDLKSNTEYHKYQLSSLQVQWFWRALRSFDQAERANFLQFVTGTSKVPLQGFATLEGMNGPQKFQIHRDDRSTDRLPVAHTCFNQLDLPAYETYDKLRHMMLLAFNECTEGFGLA
ncbi:E3 ubiquitin-protein ligase HUWE1-like [Glandiceps talaboti]